MGTIFSLFLSLQISLRLSSSLSLSLSLRQKMTSLHQTKSSDRVKTVTTWFDSTLDQLFPDSLSRAEQRNKMNHMAEYRHAVDAYNATLQRLDTKTSLAESDSKSAAGGSQKN